MANTLYNRCKANLMNKVLNLASDTIKCQLHTSSYTPAATHNNLTDLTNECAASGNYATGGATLANKSVTQAATTKFDADDVTWASSTITARYAVLVDTTASNDLIICIDFGSDKSSSSGNFTIVFDAAGILTLA